ncbi:MAG: rod shape-determining protein MreD [Rhodospirillaceae bacterium]|nr:rod shape-determining protein MreD [Rhodospirillaceae bacterium]
MTFSLLHRIDLWARNLAPFALTLLMLILGTTPLHIPYFQPLGQGLVMISVYYWAVHRPGLLPAPAVFIIGVIEDLMEAYPLGVGTVVLLLVYGLASSQRRLFQGQPFLVVWWGFMMIAAGAMSLGWILTSMLAGAAIEPKPVIFAYLMTLALYPVVADLFARAQRAFLRTV